MLPPSSRLRANQQKPLEGTPWNLHHQQPSSQDRTSGEFSLQSSFFFTSHPCTCSHASPHSPLSPQGREDPPQPGTGPTKTRPTRGVCSPALGDPEPPPQPPPARCPRYLPGLQPPSTGTRGRPRALRAGPASGLGGGARGHFG